jgi:hypothetical protein
MTKEWYCNVCKIKLEPGEKAIDHVRKHSMANYFTAIETGHWDKEAKELV